MPTDREKLMTGLSKQAELMWSNANLLERLGDDGAHHAAELRGAAQITEDWLLFLKPEITD